MAIVGALAPPATQLIPGAGWRLFSVLENEAQVKFCRPGNLEFPDCSIYNLLDIRADTQLPPRAVKLFVTDMALPGDIYKVTITNFPVVGDTSEVFTTFTAADEALSHNQKPEAEDHPGFSGNDADKCFRGPFYSHYTEVLPASDRGYQFLVDVVERPNGIPTGWGAMKAEWVD